MSERICLDCGLPLTGENPAALRHYTHVCRDLLKAENERLLTELKSIAEYDCTQGFDHRKGCAGCASCDAKAAIKQSPSSAPAESEKTYTEMEIAHACANSGISDSAFESLLIELSR